jgi:hypothetical protein
METDLFLTNYLGQLLAIIIGTIGAICFLGGYMNHDKIKPLSFGSDDDDWDVDEQDMYAIATGDEEYLAAHCTLYDKHTFKDSIEVQKQEIEQEKLEIQKLRNKLAKQKLKQQMKDLKNKKSKAKDTKPNPYDAIYEECVSVLVGLGHKKAEAKQMAANFFQANPDTKTVDEFIAGVFND